MGRLTLNVLLSFAQFEREVTGERIRDKIAASKRKGMWMGGLVPIPRLSYSANALMENRNTILIDLQVEPADGFAERGAAIAMVDEDLPGSRRITLAGDRGYDTRDFVASRRALKVTPHVARNQV